MKAAVAIFVLGLPVAAATREKFNDGWRFERFGLLADGSYRSEPGALGELVTVSSEETRRGNLAAHAIDGDLSTRWCAETSARDEWLILDLGRRLAVGEVRIMPELPDLECVVEGSADGSEWSVLDGGGPGESQSFDAKGTELVWLRVTARNAGPRRWVSVREIEVRDPQGKKIELRPEDRGEGPEAPGFDDSSWRQLSLPHDWGIEGPFRMELEGATGKLPWVGIGWYRKTFTLPESEAKTRYFLDVDGAMSNAMIFLNGKQVGHWAYGYSSFRVDLGDALRPGEENVLAVRVDNKPDSSRWYPGAGLYRDVWLVRTDEVRFVHNGTFIHTMGVYEEEVQIRCDVALEADGLEGESIEVSCRIEEDGETRDSSQETVTIEDGRASAIVDLTLERPVWWSPGNPKLYRLHTSLSREGGTKYGSTVEDLGIRTIAFNATEGFVLNGELTELKGVCMHHDLGPLGTAFHRAAAERQLRILKEMGCNSIRTAHNPPAPGWVELCDRMGFLLQIEAFDTWDHAKRRNDYSRYYEEWHERDLRLMVRNFRNHPSVIMWSLGNEIAGPYQYEPSGWRRANELRLIVKHEDPTRPVTMGNNAPGAKDYLWKGIDLLGFNYKPQLYQEFEDKHTGVPVYGSETASTISSRGEYFFPVSLDKSQGRANFQVSSYDTSAPEWAMRPDVEFTAQDATQPWNLGEYVWTGFDYLGEPTPYNDDMTNLLNIQDPGERERLKQELETLGKITPPSRSSYFGIVDLCGFPKDRYYLYQSRWRPDFPMAHILPHWNWPERVGEVTPVHVYTSGDEAELFLNGKSLGRRKRGPGIHRLTWDEVKYEPGELRVVAYKEGREWATAERSTTGEPARVVAKVETIDDMSFVELTVVDEAGREVPRSNPELAFEPGDGVELLAAGNGDATSQVTMWRAGRMPAYNGKCLVIVRGSGILKVDAGELGPVEVAVKGAGK